MTRAAPTLLAITLLATFLTGCPEVIPVHSGGGDCTAALEGRSFSGPFDECGLCPCGATAGCDWTVDFVDGEMQWNFSDYGYYTEYTCTDGEIRETSNDALLGTYDADEDKVVLDGRDYTACAGACTITWATCQEVCPDVCSMLDGTSFRSEEKHECGLCPNGGGECYWVLDFNADGYSWEYSDVVTGGTYTCTIDATIIDTDSQTTIGYYDYISGRLTWDGVNYEACDGECDRAQEPCAP